MLQKSELDSTQSGPDAYRVNHRVYSDFVTDGIGRQMSIFFCTQGTVALQDSGKSLHPLQFRPHMHMLSTWRNSGL